MPVSKELLNQLKELIPPLTGQLHKGQSGRIAVVGGAQEYSGAPFFSAVSALRMGADLSHVICSPTAANSIKSYSPDLIVHPILHEDQDPSGVQIELSSLLQRLHVLVIGPGLGREDYMQNYARMLLDMAKRQNMPVLLDADGIWMIQKDPAIIRGYHKAVLTPNIVEFKRLLESLKIPTDVPKASLASRVSLALGGVTILQKGPKDTIAYAYSSEDLSSEEGQKIVDIDIEGSLKRCGGQGDILSGVVGTMLAWGECYEEGAFNSDHAERIPSQLIPLLASVGGSMVTRTASQRAFTRYGRGLVTQDILPHIGGAFAEVFEEESGRRTTL